MPQENPTETTTASTQPPNQLFDEALALQQQKSWDAALKTYQSLLDQSLGKMSLSQASVVYHNMSNIAYEKSDLLKAYTWSKKAISLNPQNKPAKESFGFYSKKFEVPMMTRQISNYDHFKKLVSGVSLDAWLSLSLVLTLLTTWLFLRNQILKRKNQISEKSQSLIKWPAYLSLLATLSIISISYICFEESQVTRAIVLIENAPIQTAPGENKPIIFEAKAGLELEVLQASQNYLQIRYPGAFSGWIQKNQVEVLSLLFEQKN